MKLSEMKYSEQITISFALLLFLVFPWLCRNVDITSAAIDPGVLSAPLLAVLSFILFKEITWWCMKMIGPVFAEYSTVYFEADFKRLTAREKVLIYLGLYILIVMGFVITLSTILIMKLVMILMLLISLAGVYQREIGVREQSGHNDGTEVEEYPKYVGLKKATPRCAAFVCWSLGRAGIENPRSGWCTDLFPGKRVCWQRNSDVQLTAKRSLESGPCQGDVFGIFFPSKNRIAHVGLVDSWGEKYVITVEGNTNEAV